jgi:hypothetical protein
MGMAATLISYVWAMLSLSLSLPQTQTHSLSPSLSHSHFSSLPLSQVSFR